MTRMLILAVLLVAGWLGLSGAAEAAVTCRVESSTDMDFGRPGYPIGQVQTTSQVVVSCQGKKNDGGQSVLVCVGAYRPDAPRIMRRPVWWWSENLYYDLYRDPGHTQPIDFAINAYKVLTLGSDGRDPVFHNFTLYGQLAAPQPSPGAGDYTESVTGVMGYTSLVANPNCDNAPLAETFQFTSKASLAGSCVVDANDLYFGSRPGLATAVTSTATISLDCTNGTIYKLKLDNGTASPTPGQRRMSPGGGPPGVIAYELRHTGPNGPLWYGNEAVGGRSTGAPVSITVYGRVPAQPTPPAGTYTDTVTVTVEY